MYPYLLAASLVANFADSLFGPLYAVYVQNIGGDILDVGSTIALYSIATGLLIILVGKFADRLSKELLTTIGFALGALGTLCYLVIDTPLELYVLQILFAVSTALLSAPLTALFAKNIDEKKAGLLWALEGGGNKMLLGFGLLIGTFVTYRFGFATVFIIIFLFQVCAAMLQGRVYMLTFQKKISD